MNTPKRNERRPSSSDPRRRDQKKDFKHHDRQDPRRRPKGASTRFSPGPNRARGRGDRAKVSTSRSGWRILHGINPLLEALRAGRQIARVWVLAGAHGPELRRVISVFRQRKTPLEEIDRNALAELCQTPKHQGIAAEVEPLKNGSLTGLVKDHPDAPLTVLITDHIQDPQNLGAIYRAADAFGVQLVFVPAHDCCSHQLASVSKASSGAVEHVPSVVVAELRTAIAELKGHGFKLVGLEAEGSCPLEDAVTPRRLAIVVGSEGLGIAKSLAGLCDRQASIRTGGQVSSLNAAMACGIALYERQRSLRQSIANEQKASDTE